MERVAFCIDETRERIPCMLNPEHLVVQRMSGLRPRSIGGGAIAGRGLSDDPVQFTGGGRTELDLRLLFDVDLLGGETGTARPEDVRDLTSRLLRLAENTDVDGRFTAPPVIRLIWGTAWNIPGVIMAIAERHESFDDRGRPRRSLVRLLLRRVAEPPLVPGGRRPPSRLQLVPPDAFDPPPAGGVPAGQAGERLVTADADEPLDIVALRRVGAPEAWRSIATATGIDDPLRIPPGLRLRLPAWLGAAAEAAVAGIAEPGASP